MSVDGARARRVQRRGNVGGTQNVREGEGREVDIGRGGRPCERGQPVTAHWVSSRLWIHSQLSLVSTCISITRPRSPRARVNSTWDKNSQPSSKTSVHHFDGSNVDLGTAAGRMYRVGVMSIQDAGDSDLVSLIYLHWPSEFN